jgi:DNA-binding PadR family transcriptional regulator
VYATKRQPCYGLTAMSSTTRLLVLGAVRIFQPVHGYDVRRELITWHAEEWASVAPGSIYNALRSLTKDGLLEVVGTKQVGSRPERTTYRLTPRGDADFQELLRETWWTVRVPLDPLIAAVSLLGFVKRDEAIAALEARIATIRGQIKQHEFTIAAVDDIETPDHVREMIRLINARIGAEIAWATKFIARLRAGEYRTLGDPGWTPAGRQPAAARAVSKRAKPKRPPTAKPKRATAKTKSKQVR